MHSWETSKLATAFSGFDHCNFNGRTNVRSWERLNLEEAVSEAWLGLQSLRILLPHSRFLLPSAICQ